jgi:hypothetical protein
MDYEALIPFYQRIIEAAYTFGEVYRQGSNRSPETVHWKAGDRLVKVGWFHFNGTAYSLTPEGRAAYEASQGAQRPKVGHKTYKYNQGDRTPNAKLTPDDVRAIRVLRETGQTLQSIADLFGIDESHVHLIVTRKRWAGVK